MKAGHVVFLPLFLLLFISCGYPPPVETEYIKEKRYDQNFVSKSCLVTTENSLGAPIGFAGCFLGGLFPNKKIAIFFTANHVFFGANSTSRIKLFFNGRVYSILSLIYSEPPADVGAMIVFDYIDNVPEPLGLGQNISVDDDILISGFHYHPIARIGNLVNLQILNKYYGYSEREHEIIFELLKGKVVGLNVHPFENIIREFPSYSLNYTQIQLDGHDFSYAGLSGLPLINLKGELVGIVSWERVKKGEFRMFSVSQKDTEKSVNRILSLFR